MMYVKVFGDSNSVEEEPSQRSAVAPEQDEEDRKRVVELWVKGLRERSEIVLKKLNDENKDQRTPRQEQKERLDASEILRGNLQQFQETTNAVRGMAPLLAKSERIRMVVEKRKADQLSQTEAPETPERKYKKAKT